MYKLLARAHTVCQVQSGHIRNINTHLFMNKTIRVENAVEAHLTCNFYLVHGNVTTRYSYVRHHAQPLPATSQFDGNISGGKMCISFFNADFSYSHSNVLPIGRKPSYCLKNISSQK